MGWARRIRSRMSEYILCPAEKTEALPPIVLPGQFERLIDTTGHETLRAEIDSMPAVEYMLRRLPTAPRMQSFIADQSMPKICGTSLRLF